MPNPPDIKVFPRRLDPSGKRGFYPVLKRGDTVADILQTDEEVTSFSIAATAEAVAAGLRVLTDTAHAPRYDDLVFGFWVDIDPALRGSAIFNGTGVVLGVEITIGTDRGQADQYSVGIRVANK